MKLIKNLYTQYFHIIQCMHFIGGHSFSGVRVARSLVSCAGFGGRCSPFVPFLLPSVLAVLLLFADYDYPFDIFKLYGESLLNNFLEPSLLSCLVNLDQQVCIRSICGKLYRHMTDQRLTLSNDPKPRKQKQTNKT